MSRRGWRDAVIYAGQRMVRGVVTYPIQTKLVFWADERIRALEDALLDCDSSSTGTFESRSEATSHLLRELRTGAGTEE